MIEKGPHAKPKIPRHERICPFCKIGVEDECHFVTTCSQYKKERENLSRAASEHSQNFNEIQSDIQKFIFLMSNEDPSLLTKLGEYVFNSFKVRQINLGLLTQ